MQISGLGTETFLYINGLGVCRSIALSDNVVLLPATASPSLDDIIAVAHSEVDIGVIAIFLRRINSQIQIKAEDSKSLAALAWNSVWYAVLLSALYNCEAVCNLQCNKPVEQFSSDSILEITNYHLHGLVNEPCVINECDASWIEDNFSTAWVLLDNQRFLNAIHSLASYRWHSNPRAQLALLWSGIEGLFNIDNELSFRLSLYSARFLSPDNKEKSKIIFNDIKKLYKRRSEAVHGSEIRDTEKAVEDSEKLLQDLVRQCIQFKGLPSIDELAP